MGPLEKFFKGDEDDLTRVQRGKAEDRETFFEYLEEDLNDWELLEPAILHGKLKELEGLTAEAQRFGWQGDDSIETKHRKDLVDRLKTLIVKAKGN